MIVITTPTGRIGRHVVNTLLEVGETIRLIARDPEKLDATVHARAEVIQGSIDDAPLLTQALDRAEALFWCVPESQTQDNVQEYYLHFANAAATAIEQTGIPRVIAISSGGKGRSQNAGPISALHAMEEVLNTTGAAFRYLRCGNFMENFLWQVEPIVQQGVFFYPFPADFPIPMVAAQDIGKTAAQWLLHRDWSGQMGIGVHGPADLSLDQAAEQIGKAINQPVRYQPVSREGYYESMLKHNSSPAYAQALLDMFAEVASGIYAAEPRTPETTTPTTLQQWAGEAINGARNSGGTALLMQQ